MTAAPLTKTPTETTETPTKTMTTATLIFRMTLLGLGIIAITCLIVFVALHFQ